MIGRPPQFALRLDAVVPDHDPRWQTGGGIAYLGGRLRLVLDTDGRMPERRGEELHLPLPPAATPRQIRDAAESWLRDEALRVFQMSALAGRRTVGVKLAFGKRGDWAHLDAGWLRCQWRLIEQPLPVIDQVIAQALSRQTPAAVSDDLFALA